MASKTSQIDSWIVDTGATEHITNRTDILKNVMPSIDEDLVIIPNGESISVKGRGNHTLSNGTKVKVVLHIPDFN